MMTNTLLILILATFLIAPLVYFTAKKIGKKTSWIIFGVLLVGSLVFALMMPEMHQEVVLEEYNWVTLPVRLTFGLLADGLSVPMIFTYFFIFAFTALFSGSYMEKRFSLGDIENNNEQYIEHW